MKRVGEGKENMRSPARRRDVPTPVIGKLSLSHLGIVAVRVEANILLTLGAALVFSALLALVIGALSLRNTGVYFLMITLAKRARDESERRGDDAERGDS